jgi:hypothetical protein
MITCRFLTGQLLVMQLIAQAETTEEWPFLAALLGKIGNAGGCVQSYDQRTPVN